MVNSCQFHLCQFHLITMKSQWYTTKTPKTSTKTIINTSSPQNHPNDHHHNIIPIHSNATNDHQKSAMISIITRGLSDHPAIIAQLARREDQRTAVLLHCRAHHLPGRPRQRAVGPLTRGNPWENPWENPRQRTCCEEKTRENQGTYLNNLKISRLGAVFQHLCILPHLSASVE